MATLALTRVQNLLEANGPLVAVVGSDIYWPYFPATPPLPGVCFFAQPGGGSRARPLREISIQVHCYAATALAARELYELLRTAMIGTPSDPHDHQNTLRTHGIVSISEEQDGQDLVDETGHDKGTPYVLGFFTIILSDS